MGDAAGIIGARLFREANAAGVLVINEEALGAETGVVGVVALRAQVGRIAQEEQWQHIDERMRGRVQAIPEGEPLCRQRRARRLRHPNVRRLHAFSGQPSLKKLF